MTHKCKETIHIWTVFQDTGWLVVVDEGGVKGQDQVEGWGGGGWGRSGGGDKGWRWEVEYWWDHQLGP